MGLISVAGVENRVEDSTLSVTYSKAKISGTWSWLAANMEGYHEWMWEYRRVARKSFRYVGMTKAGANTKAAALRTFFTRTTRLSRWDGSCVEGQWIRESGGESVMADICVRHVSGNMYEVAVDVHEEDVAMDKLGSISYASKFLAEDQRTYDPDLVGGE